MNGGTHWGVIVTALLEVPTCAAVLLGGFLYVVGLIWPIRLDAYYYDTPAGLRFGVAIKNRRFTADRLLTILTVVDLGKSSDWLYRWCLPLASRKEVKPISYYDLRSARMNKLRQDGILIGRRNETIISGHVIDGRQQGVPTGTRLNGFGIQARFGTRSSRWVPMRYPGFRRM